MTAPARYERPAVLAEIPLDGHAVIEASAGTGKTFTLEHLIVEILLSGRARIGEILVVTFTEKATGELRARVRRILQKLLDLEPGAGPGPEVPGARCWIVGEKQRELLREALAGFDSATICTIHSFCRSVLTENAFANQRLFDEELVDGREAFGAAFRDALREDFATDGENRELLRLFLAEGGSVGDLEETLWRCHDQKARIEPAFDPERFERLAEGCGLDAEAVAQVQAEMACHNKRLMKKFGPCLEALAEALERGRSAPDLAARLEAFAELQAVDVEYLLQRLGELSEGTRGQGLVAPLQRLWDLVPSLKALVAARFFPRVSERVARRKRESGQFDFQDMLGLVRDSLEGPHGAALIELLRERYRFALIDEFQDTDETQWAVFRRLFFLSEGRCRLYLIGDPKQAIYAFRGADVHTYLAAREEVLGAGGARVVIGRNFRSTADLIAGYNRILDQSAAQPFFTGPIRYDEPVECGDAKLAALGPDGAPLAPVHVLHLASVTSVARDAVTPVLGACIAREIRRLTDPENPGLRFDRNDGLGPRPLRRRDVYVLARSRGELNALGESLRAAGVDHAFYKQEGLFQSEEADHVLDLLEAIADPDDSSRRLRAWLTPFFGLKLAELAGGAELEEGPLVESLRAWKVLADERRYERLFGRILDDSGLVRREILAGAGERA
ncbi:MAG TPA: hypothetical protein DFS52_01400, partial [Myxococcales bacterium]|nr:hypothetical protein [Myxococcales bacterium]